MARGRPWLLLALGALRASQVAAEDAAPVQISSKKICSGYEKELTACDDLPPCSSCTPDDCRFSEWGDWYDAGGCIGLCIRRRHIAGMNNECGAPCDGPQVETKECLNSDCFFSDRNCQLGDWGNWSECRYGQRYRIRQIDVLPEHGGKQCNDTLQQTEPCGGSALQPCTFADWGDWNNCSASCGGGWRTRMRGIARIADEGSKPCAGSLSETGTCGMSPCPGRPCVLTDWSEWSACTDTGLEHLQRYRTRSLKQPMDGMGQLACSDPVRETSGCPGSDVPQDCLLSDWSTWTACSRQCGGGQHFRQRSMLSPPVAGGTCSANNLREAAPCSTEPCSSSDCRLTEWSTWSDCPAKCGSGVRTRHRSFELAASVDCVAALAEVDTCDKNCTPVDCEWDDWMDWGACTVTCGKGNMRRQRVLKTAPRNGGKACSVVDKAQIAQCNMRNCDLGCVDGSWAAWSDWSKCSASCDAGFQWRSRVLATQPNHCGLPPLGAREDHRACSGPRCINDADCTLHQWGDWSPCSSSCSGVRERRRAIASFVSGRGQPCVDQSMRDLEPCNPGPGHITLPAGCEPDAPQACAFADWGDWGGCTKKCGGGQSRRTRGLAVPARNGGDPCDGHLEETKPCNTNACGDRCQDCLWGSWTAWSGCTKCGDQRFRLREIEQLPNDCGRQCDPGAGKEVSDCDVDCSPDIRFCAWSDWDSYGICSTTCGAGALMRQRQLQVVSSAEEGDYLFSGTNTSACAGIQITWVDCHSNVTCDGCKPKDCTFADWSHWHSPTCTGLCVRHRTVFSPNNECGEPCVGPLEETKPCDDDCVEKVDCVFSSWGDWSSCNGLTSPRSRSRDVLQVAQNGGRPCVGPLTETVRCNITIQDCDFSDWSSWSGCSRSCGNGVQSRARDIRSNATRTGHLCDDGLQELRGCNVMPCPNADCQVGQWNPWSTCGSGGLDRQRQRYRKILNVPAASGERCTMALTELSPCVEDMAIDCSLSAWSMWGTCNRTCGGGQHTRLRRIDVYPVNGGKPCLDPLWEMAGCNTQPCQYSDCKLSDWTDWSQCSSTCGVGQRTRHRRVDTLPKGLGKPCVDDLVQTRACESNPQCPYQDCLWGDWNEWSGCTCSCGGGQRTRDRHIVLPPQKGGKPCETQLREQVEPCNTQTCDGFICVDGKWADWEDWQICPVTCGGGITWRSRKMAQEANECGKPAEGLMREEKPCAQDVACDSIDVDCTWSDWSAWSGCTKVCDGIKRRSRRISTHGRGNGQWCTGAVKEISPCRIGQYESLPPECRLGTPKDCLLDDWGPWGACTVTCGGGQRSRDREILIAAQFGGAGCNQSLLETAECGRGSCGASEDAVDCRWSDWEDWGACTKCGGQRMRYRHIVQQPRNGGNPCEAQASEETGRCPRLCDAPVYCGWSSWNEWSACPVTCGSGARIRTRSLELQSLNSSTQGLWRERGEAAVQGQQWYATQDVGLVESQRFRFVEITVALACGFLLHAALPALLRGSGRLLVSLRIRRRDQHLREGYTPVDQAPRNTALPFLTVEAFPGDTEPLPMGLE